MTTAISPEHKRRFTEIKSGLAQLGCRESAFVQIELLFYEALTISRSYGNDTQQNGLLAALKQLQSDEYAATAERFAKAAQREKAIRRFVNEFKIVLTKAGRNLFLQPQAQA